MYVIFVVNIWENIINIKNVKFNHIEWILMQ